MSPILAATQASVAPTRPKLSFQVSHSQINPTFHQLSLEDAQGGLAHWVMLVPLK